MDSQLYQTEPAVQVLVNSQQSNGRSHANVILVHGLEGSGDAGYITSLSQAGVQAGLAMHRFHMRTCGGTEHLCQTLYHAGLTSDLLAVLQAFASQGRTPAHLVGFSLGGNVILKLAGELGESASRWIASVCAVSAPIDLAVCARRIHDRDNWIYERRFIRRMRQRLCATGRYNPSDFLGLRSIIEIDDRITAPSFGFRDAAHYYATQSAGRFLDGIRVPTLLIQARDDILVPFEVYDHPAFQRNRNLKLLATDHGGHLGFIARTQPRFWVDHAVLEWIFGR